MPPQVLAAATLTNGLLSTFSTAYRQQYEGMKENLGRVMDLGLPSVHAQELYAYFKSAPYPRRWERGSTISSKAFASVGFSVTNYDYGLEIGWHKNDREDDVTKSLFDQAQQGGRNWGTLMERFFFECVNASADLLPAIPNAPDGAAMYSATDGASAARFGVTGGNIETGGGVASGDAVRADFWSSVARFSQMQDTEGQPLWDKSFLDAGYVVIYGSANEEVFREAFLQGRTAIGANTATSNAAVTNTILESGLSINLWPTQRITDNDWYVFAVGAQHKAVFEQTRQPLETHEQHMDNSDVARKTKEESVQWDSRHGVGVFLPYQTVKVNN